jgi:hypothetical protein
LERSDGRPELRDLREVARFRDLPEALVASASLKSAGIDSVLVDDNVIRLDWFWSNLMGGVKVEVDAENADAAREMLSQPIPEVLDVEGVGEYQQPGCPKCGSLDVNFRQLEPIAYVMAFFNLPIPLRKCAWRCGSCHAQWEDEADDGAHGRSAH